MKEFIKKHKKIIEIIIIILVGLLVSIPIFNYHVDIMVDDGVQHIARAYGLKESLKYNKLFPNIVSSFTNNFGYSWNLFYGPLSAIAIVIIDLFINNLEYSYRVLSCLCLILSGLTMYKLIKKVTDNGNAGVLAGILYMTFPYRFTDMYVRNALGEIVSFIFIPLVFLGLYNLFHDETKKSYWLTIGACGLIFTHNISTVLVAIFAFVYFLINIPKLKNKDVLITFVINVVAIITITICFWVPMLEAKSVAKYQVFEPGMMSTPEETQNNGLQIKNLFVTENDSVFVFELGMLVIVLLAISPMAIRNVDKKYKKLYIFSIVSVIISIIMSTKYFPWAHLPRIFSFIQFPWRMMIMVAFFSTIVCVINIYTIVKNFKAVDVFIISLISVVFLVAFIPKLTLTREEETLDNYVLGKISGKEKECVAGVAKEEYLPKKAYDNRFYIATREDNIYVLKGKALIENEEKDGPNYKAKIATYDDEYTVFELPYIYYPGYKVTLDGLNLSLFETENGFIGIVLGPKETGTLEISYPGSDIMHTSLLVSIISLLGYVIYIIYINVKKNDKKVESNVSDSNNQIEDKEIEKEVVEKTTIKKKAIKLKKIDD